MVVYGYGDAAIEARSGNSRLRFLERREWCGFPGPGEMLGVRSPLSPLPELLFKLSGWPDRLLELPAALDAEFPMAGADKVTEVSLVII